MGLQGKWGQMCRQHSKGGYLIARKHLWDQNELLSMVNIMQIISAKSHNKRGASPQPDLIGSNLTISHTCCPVCLVDELVLAFYGLSSMDS